MEKTVNIIEPGSFLHGLLNSDFDNYLLYRYLELEVIFAMIIEENNKSNPETTAQHIEFFINQLEVKIADNNRILRDLKIRTDNEIVKKGSVSLSQRKKNNLISLNDKTECFIKYLRNFNFKADLKKDKKPCPSITRARAFCIMIMFQNGKISLDIIESKNKIIERTEKEFSEQSGKTVYEALKTGKMIYYNFEDQKFKYILDYEYGLKLYKEKYPD